MIIHHYTALKLMIGIEGMLTSAGVALYAIDPARLTAYSVLIGVVFTGLLGTGTFIMAFLTRRDNRIIHANTMEIKNSVDGMNTALRGEVNTAKQELSDTSVDLAHSRGMKEGSDAERGITNEEKGNSTNQNR